MSKKSKLAVKKQTPGGNAMINQLRFEKEMWTARVCAYQEQYSADAFILALAEEGFGPERLNRVYAPVSAKEERGRGFAEGRH